MSEMHKHKGVERDNGSLRPHPISRVHKDKRVQRWHNASLGATKAVETRTINHKRRILCALDTSQYVNIDLTQTTDIKGLRVKFKRDGKIVGLQIDK